MKFCRDKSTDRVKPTTYLFWHRDRCSHHKFYIILQFNLSVKYRKRNYINTSAGCGEESYQSVLTQFVFKVLFTEQKVLILDKH